MSNAIRAAGLALAVLLAGLPTAAASVGLTELAGRDGDGPVTVLYPSSGNEQPVARGPFSFRFAENGAPAVGNGRLVVLSHGSGSLPWVYADLARTLVDAGFVVAMPMHRGDNALDDGAAGPPSWKLRPFEVSRAIDAVAADARFAPLLRLDRVGMYGVSAGGHTALTLAGGRWSPAQVRDHCEAHIAEDFQTCVGLGTGLDGGMLDPVKTWVALQVIGYRFDDATWYEHNDPRIAAIVAGMPFAADFDMATLATPRVPLGIIGARQDRWLVPRFHSDRVLEACASCERLADFENGGHGALFSPLRTDITGLRAEMVADPPGFDRAALPETYARITAFFRGHLLP